MTVENAKNKVRSLATKVATKVTGNAKPHKRSTAKPHKRSSLKARLLKPRLKSLSKSLHGGETVKTGGKKRSVKRKTKLSGLKGV